jgi:hypothetical protein
MTKPNFKFFFDFLLHHKDMSFNDFFFYRACLYTVRG